MSRKKKGKDIVCAVCGVKTYCPPSKLKRNQKTCSIKCRDISLRSKRYNDKDNTKICVSCKVWLPFNDFCDATGEKSGANSLQAYCNPCALKINKAWASENVAKRRESRARSAIKNKNKPKKPITEEARLRHNANGRAWRKANPEKVRLWNKLRVHRLRGIGDMPNSSEINYMLCMQDAKCTYCGKGLTNYHIDHKHPISKGGTNDVGNIQLLCATCNLKKGVIPHEEYAEKVGVHVVEGPSLPVWFDVDAFVKCMANDEYDEAILLCLRE